MSSHTFISSCRVILPVPPAGQLLVYASAMLPTPSSLAGITTTCTLVIGFAMASLSADLLGAIGDDAGQYCLYKSAATAVLSSLFVITTMSERRGTRAPALINSPPVPSPVGRLADSSCPTPCSLRLHLLHDHSVRPDHHFPGGPSIRKRPTQAPASQAFHQPHRRSISPTGVPSADSSI